MTSLSTAIALSRLMWTLRGELSGIVQTVSLGTQAGVSDG
jgi:hypothetical protein